MEVDFSFFFETKAPLCVRIAHILSRSLPNGTTTTTRKKRKEDPTRTHCTFLLVLFPGNVLRHPY